MKMKSVTLLWFERRKRKESTKRRFRVWDEEAKANAGKLASMSWEELLKNVRLASRMKAYESLRQELKKRPLNVERILRLAEYKRLADVYDELYETRARELKLYEKNAELQKGLCYLLDKLCFWRIGFECTGCIAIAEECIPCVTDCVMAELEKLGQKYRVALRLLCTHKGAYADDCIVDRVTQV
ncbi:hypothetical protein M0R45_034239 [Rubus argutus]|uniref:Uncharacterized protein n=1 Tax=Rubus argutus TaxID=59490 RepID=A0AAW1VT79_RUBAR